MGALVLTGVSVILVLVALVFIPFSVLLVVALPTLISALLATLGTLTSDHSNQSGTGVLLDIVRLAGLFVLPLTAWLAAKTWDNHRRSRTILVRGWLVAFVTPLVPLAARS